MPNKTKVDFNPGEPENLDPELKEDLEKHDKTDYSSLIKQIQAEYSLSWWYMKPKIDEWAARLKLYNNQKREKEAIGDPLLFTIHQTVLASLYSDRLSVDFLGREEGDEEVAENLNSMAEFDYDEMEKEVLDYSWIWDATFFGRGLMLAMEFDRKLRHPTPEVIDIMTWLRDPRAISVNGDSKGRGGMKFGGREIRLSKDDMRKAGVYSNFENLKTDNVDINSLVDKGLLARAEAQGLGDISKRFNEGDSGDYRCLEWWTIWKGKKVLVTLADNHKRVIRYEELKSDYFPIIDRSIYPISHDWDGVSIPDLVEDKQRGRAVLQNLALAGVKVGLHPTYLYDYNKIKNRGNLQIEFNKHIPVDGNPSGAIEEVKRSAVKQEVDWILNVLDTASQKATATPDIQQGAASEDKRTATELNLVASRVDTRYSLAAKIFGWSEKRFWKIGWYDLYKRHFEKDIDEKIIRISGSMGPKWRALTRENIIANTDPDIKIESKIISDAKKFNDLQKYRLFIKDVMAIDPQNSNARPALRKIGRLSGFRKDDVDQVLPPTVDEMTAEEENEQLDADQLVKVNVFDDDFIHIEVHNKAADTSYKKAHIKAHKSAMMLKRVKPEFNIAAQNRPQAPGEQTAEPVKFMNNTPTAAPGMPQ
jgi:hypothetical protein